MQTFLPYKSFSETASILDRARLGKQRVEAMQIITILEGKAKGNAWRNHPATKMWRDHISALKLYYNIICEEWIRRGYKQTMPLFSINEIPEAEYPPWLNDEFCLAHQSNLIRKYPAHYRPIFGDDIPDDLPYIWPA